MSRPCQWALLYTPSYLCCRVHCICKRSYIMNKTKSSKPVKAYFEMMRRRCREAKQNSRKCLTKARTETAERRSSVKEAAIYNVVIQHIQLPCLTTNVIIQDDVWGNISEIYLKSLSSIYHCRSVSNLVWLRSSKESQLIFNKHKCITSWDTMLWT